MNVQTITGIVRDSASLIIPEYNPEEWKVVRLERGEDIFGVRADKGPFGEHKYKLDLERGLSYNADLVIWKKGQGLGPRVVTLSEVVCSQLGIGKIIINCNGNPKFWEKMGYKQLGSFEKIRLNREGIMTFYDEYKSFGPTVYKPL